MPLPCILLIVPAAMFLLVFLAVCVCARLPRSAGRADCLIVLGARVRPDGSLSQTLQNRCAAAAQAWRRGAAGVVIVCGGRGRDEPVAEATAMAACLRGMGIPDATVLEEGKSVNTIENLRYAKAIMDGFGLRSAAVVTSDYHLTRALWIARDLGLPARGISAHGPRRMHRILKARLTEAISWLLYFVRKLRGRIL